MDNVAPLGILLDFYWIITSMQEPDLVKLEESSILELLF